MDPIALLKNPRFGDRKNIKVYGILGVSYNNESLYTHLNETIKPSRFLSGDEDEILISATVANMLDVDVNDYVTLEILNLKDVRVSHNFTVRGIFDDEGYMELKDVNGQAFGPLRPLSRGYGTDCQKRRSRWLSSLPLPF